MSEKKEEVERVTISGAQGTRRFDKISDALDGMDLAYRSISGYDIVATIDGKQRSEGLGEYTKQKFPGTVQWKRPTFIKEEGMFVIVRKDGTRWEQDDINKLVVDFPLTYPDSHPKKGEDILKASIRDVGDPYINHPDFRRMLMEGEDVIDIHSAKEKFQEDYLRGDPTFMDESMDTDRSSEVEFIIRNPKVEEAREVLDRETEESAFEFYNTVKTNSVRMINLLAMFGTDVDETTGLEGLRNLLYKRVKDSSTKERGMTPQKLFLQWADLPDDELALKALLSKAMMRKIIWDRAGIYEFEGNTIGNTFDGTYTYLKGQEGKSILEAIKIRMSEK